MGLREKWIGFGFLLLLWPYHGSDAAATPCDGLAVLSQALGILRGDPKGEANPILSVHSFRLGVEPLADVHPGIRDFHAVLSEAAWLAENSPEGLSPSALKEFKENLDAVLLTHAPVRIAWPEDIPAIIEGYKKEGKVSAGASIRPGSFFISYDAYGQMIRDGIFPITDIHDLFNHLPPFLVFPDYLALFQERARQVARLEQRWDDLLEHDSSFNLSSSPQALVEGIRFSTFEVVPLVIGEGQASRFVAWGGVGRIAAGTLENNFSGPEAPLRGGPKLIADNLFYFGTTASPVDPFALGPLRRQRLPWWQDYKKETPDAWLRFEEARGERGQTIEGVKLLRRQIEQIVRDNFEGRPNYGLSVSKEKTEAIGLGIQSLQKEIPQNPTLARHLSPAAYLEYYAATNALLKDYLDWFEARLLKSQSEEPW